MTKNKESVMKRISNSFFLRFVFIVSLLSGIGRTQQSKQMVIKEIQTDIQNPTGIITIDEPFDKSSPVRQIVRTEQELLFCDENFRIINRRAIDGQQMILSKKGYFLLLYKKLQSNSKVNFTLIDYKGNEHLQFSQFADKYHDIDVILSDNGTIFILDLSTLKLATIAKSGEYINKINLFDKYEGYPYKNIKIEVSKSGEYCIILTEKKPSNRPEFLARNRVRHINPGTPEYSERIDGEPHLFIIDTKGEILRSVRVAEEEVRALFINDDASMILYTVGDIDSKENYYITTLVNNKLEKIFSSNFPFVPGKVLFMEEAIVIGYWSIKEKCSKISLFDKNTGGEIWSTKLDYAPLTILNPNLKDQTFNLIACSTATIHSPSIYWIYTFDLSGKILSKNEIGKVEHLNFRHVGDSSTESNLFFIINGKIATSNLK
jgi:hypothetical protein